MEPLAPLALIKTAAAAVTNDELNDLRRSFGQGDNVIPTISKAKSEYRELASIVRVPLVASCVRIVSERLRLKHLSTSTDGSPDIDLMRLLAANRWMDKELGVYRDGLVYGYGIVSVWPSEKKGVELNYESPQGTYLFMDDGDPWTIESAVKFLSKVDPDDPNMVIRTALVYTNDYIVTYRARTGKSAALTGADWKLDSEDDIRVNPLGKVPFARFVPQRGDSAQPLTYIDPLIRITSLMDHVRAMGLESLGHTAFQRTYVTNYDPVIRDEQGNPEVLLDANGNPIVNPVTGEVAVLTDGSLEGRWGPGQVLAMAGDVKVGSLQAGDSSAFVSWLQHQASELSSASRVPVIDLPASSAFVNVSAETLETGEASLRSFITSIWDSAAQSFYADMVDLIMLASGQEPVMVDAVRKRTEPMSLSLIGDFWSKTGGVVPATYLLHLITESAAEATALEDASKSAMNRALGGDLSAGQFGPKPVDQAPPQAA